MATITAPDLRNAVALGTQPALCNDDGTIVQHQVDHMVAYLRGECKVSLRRLDNALATINLPDVAKAQLRQAWAK